VKIFNFSELDKFLSKKYFSLNNYECGLYLKSSEVLKAIKLLKPYKDLILKKGLQINWKESRADK
jgi:hypothetical protein